MVLCLGGKLNPNSKLLLIEMTYRHKVYLLIQTKMNKKHFGKFMH